MQEKKFILNCQKYSFWFCPVLLEKKKKKKNFTKRSLFFYMSP